MKTKFNFRFLALTLAGIFVSFNVWAQDIQVRGTVEDTHGDPVTGANVVVKGTTNGSITDLDGNFTLKAPKGSTLVVSFIGYTAQEVPAAANVKVTLSEDTEMLDDVVVIGYGVAKKNDLTGSVLAIKPDEMSKGITTSTQDMLVGKAPGVTVIGDGTPGGSATIRIRGGASLNASNDPLYIIDGLAIDGKQIQGQANLLSIVNPNDIESMTVLKDASATAIYGSRASNGVILITTKKGRKNMSPQVTYNISGTISTPRKTYDLMSASEYRAYVESVDPSLVAGLGDADTDWQDEIFRTAGSLDQSISISGAYKNLPYRASIGFATQNGILKTSKDQRFNAALSLSPSFLKDHLKFNVNAKYSNVYDRYADTGAIGKAMDADPTQPVKNGCEVTGGYWQVLNSGVGTTLSTWDKPAVNTNAVGNPVALLEQKNDRARTNSFMGNIDFDYKIHGFEDLHIHGTFGGEYHEALERENISPYSAGSNYYGWSGRKQTYKYEMQGNLYAQYMHTFEKQYVDVMVGTEQSHDHRLYYEEGIDPYEGQTNVGVAHNSETLRSEKERLYRTSLLSYFGRVNYTLLDRYLFTATMRFDGSSHFDDDNKWGQFPSLAASWKINEESFLENADWLSELKLRYSWGITGQQQVPDGYEFYYLPTYVVSDQYAQYTLGQTNYYTSRPQTYNHDLKWETTTTNNIGLDMGVMDGRITASLDAYYRETKDLLAEVSVASGTNFGNYELMNIGTMVNKGIEFTIDARPVQTKDFMWQITYNIGWNDNEITSLNTGASVVGKENATYGLAGSNYVSVNAKGHPVNSFWVFQQVYDEDGKPIEGLFVDRNGDGVISNDDKYFYKKPTADVLMGMTNKFVWKNWDASFTFRASLNNYLYDGIGAKFSHCNTASYLYSNSDYHNTTKAGAELGWTGLTNFQHSDYFVKNASFLRCDNINIGYSFQKLFATSAYKGISGRVYATVQNPFVITNYDGLDPEITSAVDSNVYPKPMSFQLGLSLNF